MIKNETHLRDYPSDSGDLGNIREEQTTQKAALVHTQARLGRADLVFGRVCGLGKS